MNTPTDPQQHKQQTAALFDLVAPGYDNEAQRFFAFCADRLIEHLRPAAGQKLLDIATGTGAVASAAAQAVGAAGRVHGIDLSQNMLERAEQNLRKFGLTNVDLHVMDAEAPEFKSRYFDAATCSFALFFMPDMPGALRQWLRVLKPGGHLALTTFGPNAFRPLAEIFRDQLAGYGVEIGAPRWMCLSEPRACADLLTGAGFRDIRVDIEQHGYHLAGPDDWWTLIWNSGFRAFIGRLPRERQGEFRVAHLDRISQLMTKDGLWLNIEVLFTLARRPDE